MNRIKLFFFEFFNPHLPWLTKDAIILIDKHLKQTHQAFEIGSGRSTIWTLKKVAFLTSIESDINWYKKIRDSSIEEIKSNKFNYLHLKSVSEYTKAIQSIDDNSLDFCLIDGEFRDICAIETIPKIAINGMLVIDNINWFIPSLHSSSPASIKEHNKFFNENWKEFYMKTSSWEYIWTSNGVTDTGIFLKPSN